MKLCDYLKPENICVNLAARKKDTAIEELGLMLAGDPAVKDSMEFLNAVYAREKDGSTGIGNLVAIPHARTDSVTDFVVAIGVSKQGVDFRSNDGKSVNLVMLMGVPDHMIKAYLKLLAHLSVLFRQKGFVDKLQSAVDADDVIRTFVEYEE